MSIVYSKYDNCSCDPFWDIGRLNNGIFHIFRGFFLQVWVDVQTGMKASTFLIFMSVTYMYMNIVYNKYENCSYYSFWDISGQSNFFLILFTFLASFKLYCNKKDREHHPDFLVSYSYDYEYSLQQIWEL